MIDLDGSHGEGGGQILRTALSLSAVTGQPVKISKIRHNRPNPGLAPSHITSIEAVAEICDADVDGLYPGSKEITFRPGQITGGRFEFDVGTAGSISLVVQGCLIPAIMSKSEVRMTVKGGTDVKWSPPIDYMRLVHFPLLSKFGPSGYLEIVRRGFYPEGGGEVKVEIAPTSRLAPLALRDPGRVLWVEGIAYAQNLPEHVVTRMKHASLKRLVGVKEVRIESDSRRGDSTGAGIVLAAQCENTVLGASALGARGVKAETLGEACATDILETIKSGVTVDEHMLDQILPYMALAEPGSSILSDEISNHASTNIWVIEQFLGKKFSSTKKNGLTEVSTA